MPEPSLSPFDDAPQHGPRPLPLFLELLRSETAASPERRRAALAGLAAYQRAPRAAPPPPLPEVARAGRATLRQASAEGHPLVLVPSLINPPFVLDMPGGSLLRWLGERGFSAHLVDWGAPTLADRDVDLDAHVTDMLVPLLRSMPRPPLVVGYCLGGTLATAAANLTPLAGLAQLAAPWRFAGYGEAGRGRIAELWHAAEATCQALGLVPMEVLQSGFWRLDPRRTVAKFERFAALDPDGEAAQAFVRLEDWANGGAPIPYAAGRQMFDDLFDADLPGRGVWRVGGAIVGAPPCPAVGFVSATDRIVPAASAMALADTRPIAAGHVGMIVGASARALLWKSLADWLSGIAAPK